MINDFRNSVALRYSHSHHLFEAVRREELHWSTTDLGATHGAILVERFRSLNRAVHHLDRHWARLNAGVAAFGIELPFDYEAFQTTVDLLFDSNTRITTQCADVGVVFLVSPGDPESVECGGAVTCMTHLVPLPWKRMASWYRYGINLIRSEQQLVPVNCWTNQIKTRSRLNYWLADRAVAKLPVTDSSRENVGLLMTGGGTVGDCSVANVLVVGADGVICSPRLSDVLPGCTLGIIDELVRDAGGEIVYRDLSWDDLRSAQEVLLTGSTGIVWSATQLEGARIGKGVPGPICEWLSRLFSSATQCDFRSQAI